MTNPGVPSDMASFADELEATFLEELYERLRSMEAALVGIERPTDPAGLRTSLEQFGREAHNLKGGAQLVGREGLAQIAHALETRLEKVRQAANDEPVDIQPLFEAVEALERLRRSGESANVDVGGLVSRLTERVAATAPPSKSQAIRGLAARRVPAARTAKPASAGASPIPSAQGAETGGRTAVADQPRTVRVGTERLDALMNRTADLAAARDAAARRAEALRSVVARLGSDSAAEIAGVAEIAREVRAAAREARTESQRLAVLTEALETDLLALRMVPLASLFREFPRLVRDLARATGKEVQLESLGWETPMDRELVERLRDPVMHLLRNAVDHGIEAPDVRRAKGKPATGTIILEARPRAGGITIEVRDDGSGVDLGRVRARAGEAGLVSADDESATPTLGLIFQLGVSTADAVTEVSGRGIGLDAVRATVGALGGTVEVTSEPGLGTRFALRLPLTLVSTTVLVVRARGARYGLPLSAIERAVRLETTSLTTLGGRSSLEVPGGPVVLTELTAMLGEARSRNAPAGTRSSDRTVLVLATASGRAGIVVDGIESERDIVLKSLGFALETTPLLAGAALVDGDALLLVLDADAVVDRAMSGREVVSRSTGPSGGAGGDVGPGRPADRSLRVLVVDDSITSRTLEKSILAAAGFDVTLAVDGQDALRAIRSSRPDVIVSDVDMPVLDGIDLTMQLRASDATRDIPIILVTSLDAPEQRDRGLLAGADAYLTKQAFDQQELLQTIRELVG